MTPDQIRKALRINDGEIVGLKKAGFRSFGTTFDSPNRQWPPGAVEAIETRKKQSKEYRRMLEPKKETSG